MKTLIIDNYDSFTFNLYQLIGDLEGNPHVKRNDEITIREIIQDKFTHIVISPGSGTPQDEAYFGICKKVILQFGSRLPILGVCLGHQGIIFAYGGKIVRASQARHGKTSVISHTQKGLFSAIPSPFKGMRYHSLVGEKVSLPSCLHVTATSDDGHIMGIKHKEFPTFGVQFHPESIGTEYGNVILQNFLRMRSRV